MKNEKTQFISHWMEGTGPYAEVTISSRVRLARNIKDIPVSLSGFRFPDAEGAGSGYKRGQRP